MGWSRRTNDNQSWEFRVKYVISRLSYWCAALPLGGGRLPCGLWCYQCSALSLSLSSRLLARLILSSLLTPTSPHHHLTIIKTSLIVAQTERARKLEESPSRPTPTKYCARYNTTTNQVHMDVYMKIGYHYTRYTLDSSDLYWYCTSIPGFEYTTYVAVRCCWCKRRRPRPQVLNHRNHNRNNN